MDLLTIARQILKEDAPIANTVTQPQAAQKYYDVLKDFQTFERTIDQSTESAKKQLETTINKSIGRKKVIVRASKGTMGQVEQDYTLDVLKVSITYLKDEYFIMIKAKDNKDYYINTAFKIKVVGDASASQPAQGQDDQQNQPDKAQNTEQPSLSGGHMRQGAIGGIKQPQNMGLVGGSQQ